MSHISYSCAFESIMYAMVCITTDISYAVTVISSSKVQWQEVKLILYYLWGAIDVDLAFNIDNALGSSVVGYIKSML